jgi:hypothetical protein
MLLASSTIIEDIRGMCKLGLASLAFFYCDFRHEKKKDRRDLLSSLLIQLCGQSGSYYDILSNFYSAHDDGSQHPGDKELTQCLKVMLDCPGQAPIYIIVDALDECPTSYGTPSPRDNVLNLIEGLVGLHLPNLHICVTSRPESDIQAVLNHLTTYSISLHEERGQMQDIREYVKSAVNSDPGMRRWRPEDKEHVVETLSRKASGM